MKLTIIAISLLLIAVAPLAGVTAEHDAGCEPGGANAEDINQIDAGETTIYIEERDSELGPVPGSGLFFGEGTWIYEESNGVPGMQRGGSGDSVTDEDCGHGPDTLIF